MSPRLDSRTFRRLAPLVALVVIALLASGCGGSAVTADRLEDSVARSFTRMYDWQRDLVGQNRPADLGTQARCVRGNSGDQGAGSDWTCTIQFYESGPSTPVTFSYEVSVHPDLCWSAEHPPRSLGGATIRTKSGRTVPNPVYAIDSCFQAT